MGLLDKLTKQNSTLTAFNGATPNKYDKESGLVNATNEVIKSDSVLDLDGQTPSTAYKNTAPENQGGKV
jgi:hypothetical protein